MPSLKELVSRFVGVLELVGDVRKPFGHVYSGLTETEGDINRLQSFLGDLNNSVTLTATLGDACYKLSEVPEIGVIFDALWITVHDFGTGVRKLLKPINAEISRMIEEAQEAIQHIDGILWEIIKCLNFYLSK